MKLNRMLSVFALVAVLVTASVSFAANNNGPLTSSIRRSESKHRNSDVLDGEW